MHKSNEKPAYEVFETFEEEGVVLTCYKSTTFQHPLYSYTFSQRLRGQNGAPDRLGSHRRVRTKIEVLNFFVEQDDAAVFTRLYDRMKQRIEEDGAEIIGDVRREKEVAQVNWGKPKVRVTGKTARKKAGIKGTEATAK